MRRSVLQGLAAFRWAAWVWLAVVAIVSPTDLVREWLAVLLVGGSLFWTAFSTWLLAKRPAALVHPIAVLVELAAGASLLAFDGLVRPRGEVFSSGQSLASVWPVTGVMAAGAAFGPGGGAVAGAAVGSCRYASTILNGVTDYGDGRVLSLVSTVVVFTLAGSAFGYAYRLLERAREEVAEARAREEVARTLHDGVLQTLALVERRAVDPALARLARDQERELRAYLFGDARADEDDLPATLRRVAGRFEDQYGGRVEVVVTDDVRDVPRAVAHAVSGAVGEALTNAGKHGSAQRVVVFLDVEEAGRDGAPDELFCSVRDDGAGFDAAAVTEGVGLGRSIRGRIAEVGGDVRIESSPGAGAEIQVRVPLT